MDHARGTRADRRLGYSAKIRPETGDGPQFLVPAVAVRVLRWPGREHARGYADGDPDCAGSSHTCPASRQCGTHRHRDPDTDADSRSDANGETRQRAIYSAAE